jgi:hypothetical protein
VEHYDPSKIGRLISGRSQHTVYAYNETEVIKFDRFDYLLGARMSQIEERDVAILKKYFGEYLLDTRLMRAPDGSRKALVQPRIDGHYLCASDFENAVTRSDFIGMMHARDMLIADGFTDLDLLGSSGLFSRCMSNVFAMPDGHLKIIDPLVADFDEIPSKVKWFLGPLGRMALRRQEKMIKVFLALAKEGSFG